MTTYARRVVDTVGEIPKPCRCQWMPKKLKGWEIVEIKPECRVHETYRVPTGNGRWLRKK